MIFLPYFADLELDRKPVITVLICVLCVWIFISQQESDHQTFKATSDYCQSTVDPGFWRAIEKITGRRDLESCARIMALIHSSVDQLYVIQTLAEHAAPYQLLTAKEGRKEIITQLSKNYERFDLEAKPNLTRDLMYVPGSYNPYRMLTSVMSHASWGHIIGNLVFFVAFATTVEAIVGPVLFILVFIGLVIGTNIAYTLWCTLFISQPLPTIGLSGVVMGMIGLFTYFLPTARILCLLWLIVWHKVFKVPAWILAIWYVGWDLYGLIHMSNQPGTNFVIHVGGAVMGFLMGAVIFRTIREGAQENYLGVIRPERARKSRAPTTTVSVKKNIHQATQDPATTGDQPPRDEVRDMIRRLPLFNGLTRDELNTVRQWAPVVAYKSGNFIYKPGTKGDGIYVVLDGKIDLLSLDDNGNPVVTASVGPGEYFGESALLTEKRIGKHNHYTKAARDSRLIRIPQTIIASLLSRDSALIETIRIVQNTRKPKLQPK